MYYFHINVFFWRNLYGRTYSSFIQYISSIYSTEYWYLFLCIYFYPIFIQIFLLVSNIVLTLLCFRFPSGLAMAMELVKVDIFVMFEAVLKNGNALDIIISWRFLNFRNQKLTIVNSTRAANTKAVHKPIHTSNACNGKKVFRKNTKYNLFGEKMEY